MGTVKDSILRWQYGGRIFTYWLGFEIFNTQITTLCLQKKCICPASSLKGSQSKWLITPQRPAPANQTHAGCFNRFDTDKIWQSFWPFDFSCNISAWYNVISVYIGELYSTLKCTLGAPSALRRHVNWFTKSPDHAMSRMDTGHEFFAF